MGLEERVECRWRRGGESGKERGKEEERETKREEVGGEGEGGQEY